jgi:GDPmannose 4,6-dehydratase
MKIKRVLITGITGMVGSHLLDLLSKNSNLKIYGLCRWNSKLDNIISHMRKINSNNIELICGDLRDPISIYKLMEKSRPDQIYHLAAQSFPTASFSNPIETYETNINGTATILEASKNLKNKNIKIHICSSSEVYGKVDKKYIPINEFVPFHPASPYAISKVGTDLVAQHYAEAYGLNIFITRMFTHTGPRRSDFFHESTFAKQIALIEKKIIPPIIKVGNLDSLRTYADVRDAVKAYSLLMNSQKTKPGDVFNIGGDYSCTVRETLNFLIKLSHFKKKIKIVVEYDRLRPLDADLQVPDISKFKNITYWKEKYTYKKTMVDLLNFWRKRIKESGDTIIR